MGYMIEGGGSKTMSKSKAWLTDFPDDSKRLLDMLTSSIIDYLEMQIKSGAQMVQVFESSAEHLSKDQFVQIALPHLRTIREKLVERLNNQSIPIVPMVTSCFLISLIFNSVCYFKDNFCERSGTFIKRTSFIRL